MTDFLLQVLAEIWSILREASFFLLLGFALAGVFGVLTPLALGVASVVFVLALFIKQVPLRGRAPSAARCDVDVSGRLSSTTPSLLEPYRSGPRRC